MEHTCEEVQGQLLMLVNGSLEAHAVVIASNHLQTCGVCRGELAFIVQMRNDAKAHFSSAPDDAFFESLWTEIRQSVAEEWTVPQASKVEQTDARVGWPAPMTIAQRVLALVQHTCTRSIADALKTVTPAIQRL